MSSRHLVVLITALLALASTAPALAGPPQPAGPEVRYGDAADDAYRTPLGAAILPDPSRSDPALDIREVVFAPERKGKYMASILLAAAPSQANTYVSAGFFSGQDCQMYHFLRLGARAYATLFCGSGAERRALPPVWGDVAEAVGKSIQATFSNRELPADLEAANSTLSGLFSWSCPSGGVASGNGCQDQVKMDTAESSTASYVLRAPPT